MACAHGESILEQEVTDTSGSTDSHEVTYHYVYGLDLIARIEADDTNPVQVFFQHDGRGSVRSVVEPDGDQAAAYDYEAFGALRSSEPSEPNQFRFTGEFQDSEAANDLYYLRARYYDPELGRFWTEDPWPGSLPAPQTQMRYPYVANNPVNFADPFGLCPTEQVQVFPAPSPPGVTASPLYSDVTCRDLVPSGDWGRVGDAFGVGKRAVRAAVDWCQVWTLPLVTTRLAPTTAACYAPAAPGAFEWATSRSLACYTWTGGAAFSAGVGVGGLLTGNPGIVHLSIQALNFTGQTAVRTCAVDG
jgi:RHS repeat-associated protein